MVTTAGHGELEVALTRLSDAQATPFRVRRCDVWRKQEHPAKAALTHPQGTADPMNRIHFDN
jgi:hypothetical protein